MFKTRRQMIKTVGASGLLLLSNGVRSNELLTPRQSLGPFYPDELPLEYDNDLTQVAGQPQSAQGELTDVIGRVILQSGEVVVNAHVEIWQCDVFGRYHHPRDRGTKIDRGFQGYGRTITNSKGEYRFRTIKPVPYPGRTPHIHFLVRGEGIEPLVTQMYIAGEKGNERDGLLNSIGDQVLRDSLIVELRSMDEGVLNGRFDLVVASS